MEQHVRTASVPDPSAAAQALVLEVGRTTSDAWFKRLRDEPPEFVARVVERLPAPQSLEVLKLFEEAGTPILEQVDPRRRRQWEVNRSYPEDTVGRLMELPVGVYPADLTVAECTERLRGDVKHGLITYAYVTDAGARLIGLVVMRDLLLAEPHQTLGQIMQRKPFALTPETPLAEAMRAAVGRHFPVYPICDAEMHIVGLVRGVDLFEQNMFSLVVQAGSMVGVEREERIGTAWPRALRMRNPWLLLNLLTAFVAGGVVSLFEGTIAQVVALAAFLPVLAGQSGNTGCQALAVTLRGMSLGELSALRPTAIVMKEAWLGLLNGAIVGVPAAVAMLFVAGDGGPISKWSLALVVFLAMTGSCVASGISGALVPMILKRLGADPATASSIFLTTATDVVSMGLLLGLAATLVG